MRQRAFVVCVALAACSGGVDIEGNVYVLDLDDMQITGADPDLAPVLALFFNSPVLLQTFDASADGFSTRMGYATVEGDLQDECVGTSPFPAATLVDGTFTMGPESTEILTTTSSFTIGELEAAGTFSDDYEGMGSVSLSGSVDLRQAVGFAGITSGEGACNTFEGLGLPCGPCADAQPFCADLEITGLTTTTVELAMVPITAAEAAANCP